jgi:hypothetical protein
MLPERQRLIELWLEASPGKKVIETLSQQKYLGMVVRGCHPNNMESISRRILVHSNLSKNVRPYVKYSQSKRVDM